MFHYSCSALSFVQKGKIRRLSCYDQSLKDKRVWQPVEKFLRLITRKLQGHNDARVLRTIQKALNVLNWFTSFWPQSNRWTCSRCSRWSQFWSNRLEQERQLQSGIMSASLRQAFCQTKKAFDMWIIQRQCVWLCDNYHTLMRLSALRTLWYPVDTALLRCNHSNALHQSKTPLSVLQFKHCSAAINHKTNDRSVYSVD